MHSATLPDSLRRSSRVPVNVPILVTSLEPDSDFSQLCETMVVNAHGCPVIFVGGSAQEADLIVASVNSAVWPGEPVRT